MGRMSSLCSSQQAHSALIYSFLGKELKTSIDVQGKVLPVCPSELCCGEP